VKDKDGVSTLVRVLQLAAQAKAAGRTLVDLLDDLAVKHGLHATDQLSARVEDLALIGQAMERLRATPPRSLGAYTVERIDDLSEGSESLPPTDGLRYTLSEGARVVVRPSGTEPKLKCYLEVVVPVTTDVAAARTQATDALAAIKTDLAAAAGI
jgi:phosphomannomutase